MITHYAPMLIGACAALLIWQLMSVFNRVPSDSRLYRDAPATGFRLVWPLIRLVVFYTAAFMPKKSLERLQLALVKAGAEFSLTAQEALAAKYLSACLFAVIGLVFVLSIGSSAFYWMLVAALLGYGYPDSWLKQQARQRQNEMLKHLPFYLDVITLSVEAGSNLTGGITQAVQKNADTVLRRELGRVLRDIRSGKTRADALRDFAARADSSAIQQVVSGLIQAEKSGASLGPLLRAQSEQLRTQRFQLAEKKAMEAPVKLFAPLFGFIFPMVFVALGYVMLSKAIQGGMLTWPPLVWAYTWPGG